MPKITMRAVVVFTGQIGNFSPAATAMCWRPPAS
jgi:hypothetical protein